MSAPSPSRASGPSCGWLLDAAWGLVLAGVVTLLLLLSASPHRADRGFIYVDF